jgi:hypothetical protein
MKPDLFDDRFLFGCALANGAGRDESLLLMIASDASEWKVAKVKEVVEAAFQVVMPSKLISTAKSSRSKEQLVCFPTSQPR